MDTILTLTGIGALLPAIYLVSQVLMLEGRGRVAHAPALGLIPAAMAALTERHVPLARFVAAPLGLASLRTALIAPRWYRIFPLITVLFALPFVMGYVAMT